MTSFIQKPLIHLDIKYILKYIYLERETIVF